MPQNKARPEQRASWRVFARTFATQLTIAAALVVLCVILTIASPYFLQLSNFMNIGIAISVAGTMAAGLTVVIISGQLDLSQYAVMAFVSMISSVSMTAGLPPVLAIVLSALLGVVIGAANAFIVVKMEINPFIATIATQLVFRAGAYLVNNGAYVSVTNPVYEALGYGRLFGIPCLILILIVIFIIFGYVLKNTTFGRQVYAVGGNPVASELSGINVQKIKALGFVISGFTAGIAAVLVSAQVGSAMPTSGMGREMDAMAAVFLGGTALSGGKGNMSGTVLGVLLLAVLENGMTLLSVPQYFQQIIKGIVLLLSVYFDIVRNQKAKSVRVKA